MDTTSFSLFHIFFEEFDVDTIFRLGWEAAREWTAMVSATILLIATMIAVLEEKYKGIANDRQNYQGLIARALTITAAVALYHTMAWLVIQFSKSMWSMTSTGLMSEAGRVMDQTLQKLWEKDKDFDIALSDLGDGILSIFGFLGYWFTYVLHITVSFFMKIAHTLIMSFVLFWGAVALPMSVTIGLRQIQALKTVTLLVIIWPIVENFLFYLVSGVLLDMLGSSKLNIDNFEAVTTSTTMFYYTIFGIMNFLLSAIVVSAPFIAWGFANNSGNITGAIASFAGAGVAAGMFAGKMAQKSTQATQGAGKLVDLARDSKQALIDGQSGVKSIADFAKTGVGQAADAVRSAKSMFAAPTAPSFADSVGVGSAKGGTSINPEAFAGGAHNKAPDLGTVSQSQEKPNSFGFGLSDPSLENTSRSRRENASTHNEAPKLGGEKPKQQPTSQIGVGLSQPSKVSPSRAKAQRKEMGLHNEAPNLGGSKTKETPADSGSESSDHSSNNTITQEQTSSLKLGQQEKTVTSNSATGTSVTSVDSPSRDSFTKGNLNDQTINTDSVQNDNHEELNIEKNTSVDLHQNIEKTQPKTNNDFWGKSPNQKDLQALNNDLEEDSGSDLNSSSNKANDEDIALKSDKIKQQKEQRRRVFQGKAKKNKFTKSDQ